MIIISIAQIASSLSGAWLSRFASTTENYWSGHWLPWDSLPSEVAAF